jgi:hypothetical protein
MSKPDYTKYPMTGNEKDEAEVFKRVADAMEKSPEVKKVVKEAISDGLANVLSRKKRSGKKSKRSGKKSKRSDGKRTRSKGCFMSYHRKYQGRPGPPFPAQDCKNFKKRGNDMYLYKSKRNKKGIYQWRKISE